MSGPSGSYTAGGGLLGTAREFAHLARAYRAVSKRIPQDVKKTIDDCAIAERSYLEATGEELAGKLCLELGAGQQLLMAKCFARRNRVIASDLEQFVRGFDLRGYWRMLRSNGPKRLIKTLGRKVLSLDGKLQRELQRQLGGPPAHPVEFVQCDATKMPFAEGSIDFIYSYNVFEHLPDPGAIWRDCRRVLRPGGCVFTHLHNYTSDSGCHDLRIIRGERDDVPLWPHLRPSADGEVLNQSYLNKLSFDQWHELIARELPGAKVWYIRDEQHAATLATLRAAGELAAYHDDELLTAHILCMWRKPL